MSSVSVLISLYKPDKEFLKRQLRSINDQTFKDMDIIAYNDDPTSENLESLIVSCISNFPVRYIHTDKNRGYTKAFEYLTGLARSEYVVYCDQDDEWESSRVSRAVEVLEQGYVLACGDYSVIDERDDIVIPSWKDAHPKNANFHWHSGDDITKYAAFSCYAIGMVTCMRTAVAQSLLPFPECTGHDKWLALGASALGRCAFIDEPLVRKRAHESNITGTLSGITSKSDWYDQRVRNTVDLAKYFVKRFPDNPNNDEIEAFAKARADRNARMIRRYAYLEPNVAQFEIALRFIPEPLFKAMVRRYLRYRRQKGME